MDTLTAADFDAASAGWMANKIRRGPMIYYRCEATTTTGAPCCNAVYSPDPMALTFLCKNHKHFKARSTTPESSSGSSDDSTGPRRSPRLQKAR